VHGYVLDKKHNISNLTKNRSRDFPFSSIENKTVMKHWQLFDENETKRWTQFTPTSEERVTIIRAGTMAGFVVTMC